MPRSNPVAGPGTLLARSAASSPLCSRADEPKERRMAMATQNAARTRSRLSALPAVGHPPGSRIEIVENPISSQDPRLGAEVEEEIHRVLRNEDLGSVQVRFRVCRDEFEGLKFICKVENPPRVDGDGAAPP